VGPHPSEKTDMDLLQHVRIRNTAMEAQSGAVEAHSGGMKAHPRVMETQLEFGEAIECL
jgi:hypothetical protein